jgi:hypothetical protein
VRNGVTEVPPSKMTKKARLAGRKAAKQAKRGAASDDEDLGAGKAGAFLSMRHFLI